MYCLLRWDWNIFLLNRYQDWNICFDKYFIWNDPLFDIKLTDKKYINYDYKFIELEFN
jgi:hypothetical protein